MISNAETRIFSNPFCSLDLKSWKLTIPNPDTFKIRTFWTDFKWLCFEWSGFSNSPNLLKPDHSKSGRFCPDFRSQLKSNSFANQPNIQTDFNHLNTGLYYSDPQCLVEIRIPGHIKIRVNLVSCIRMPLPFQYKTVMGIWMPFKYLAIPQLDYFQPFDMSSFQMFLVFVLVNLYLLLLLLVALFNFFIIQKQRDNFFRL